MPLDGSVAIITGASSGIGEATAKAFAAEGAHVMLAARRVDRLEALADTLRRAETGGADAEARVAVCATDVTDREQVEHLAEATLEAFGRIDILVNNAGLMPLSFMKNLHVDEWDRMIDVNLRGVLYCTAAVLPHFRAQGSGHFINVSSIAGRRVFPSGAVYCATKFAVNALSEGLRQELTASEGIKVSVIEPGGVATELPRAITDEDVLAGSAEFANMRMLDADDIARAIVYAVAQPEHVNVSELQVLPREEKV